MKEKMKNSLDYKHNSKTRQRSGNKNLKKYIQNM
jgi:hypothetical protein